MSIDAGWLYDLQEDLKRVWNKLYSFIDPNTVPVYHAVYPMYTSAEYLHTYIAQCRASAAVLFSIDDYIHLHCCLQSQIWCPNR